MEVLPTPDQELAWRLAAVEDRLEAISERLGRLETSLREAVGAEVHGATAELRRAISELGRRLVQDLPAELGRHRDAIVAELRTQLAPPPAPPPPPAPAPPDLALDPPVDQAAGPDDVDVVDAVPDTPEAAERRRALHRRRRQA
ncbi:MAG TPA: hypothetical protein VHT97_08125 [Acidimicrobiales bacterium]|jgi:hypothetical protein|nr:hypothetical protein [Acidimicrobiales bacterium]